MEEIRSKVLVVDDIQSNIEFVTDVLELENLHIIGANDGEAALKIALEENPDLILLDISMPILDGYQVCQKLKESDKTKEIPVIFLTARVQKEDIIKGFEQGAVDYIVKPFNFNELISRVNTHLDLKHKTARLKDINNELEGIVTERTKQLKTANAELQVANDELNKVNKELENLDKAKTEFVLHINHELRTPLNGILGYTALLKENISNDHSLKHVNSIESLTNNLIRLAELSLLFTELKTQNNKVKIGQVNLLPCLDDVFDRIDFSEKNVEVELENPYDEVTVLSEQKLLTTCLTIVYDNSIKYSDENGHVVIVIKKQNNNTLVEFHDNGPGFSEKAKEDLFKFFTADNLDYHSYGFGVGLATAKIILDLIGGSIQIENKDSKGALVTLIFPT